MLPAPATTPHARSTARAAGASAVPVSGAADARAKTSQLIEAGVDWIKVINAGALTPEEMKAIVDEAHARGRKVAAHAFSEAEIGQGLVAGVDDFQHVRTQTPEYPPDVVALIHVIEGKLNYRVGTLDGSFQLSPDAPGVVIPEIGHHVEAIGLVRFFVEFYKRRANGST